MCVLGVGGRSGVILIQAEPRYLAQADLGLTILLPECRLYICHLTNHRHHQVRIIKESASTDGKKDPPYQGPDQIRTTTSVSRPTNGDNYQERRSEAGHRGPTPVIPALGNTEAGELH